MMNYRLMYVCPKPGCRTIFVTAIPISTMLWNPGRSRILENIHELDVKIHIVRHERDELAAIIKQIEKDAETHVGEIYEAE